MENNPEKVYYTVSEMVDMGIPLVTINNACHTESAKKWLIQGGRGRKRAIHLEKFLKYMEKQL